MQNINYKYLITQLCHIKLWSKLNYLQGALNLRNSIKTTAMVLAIGLSGCAPIKIRPYVPLLSPPEAALDIAFESAFHTCVNNLNGGLQTASYSSGATTAAGIAAGVGTAATVSVTGGAAAAAIPISGAAAGTIILVPIAVGYGAVRGVAVLRRNGQERRIQAALTQCMAQSNYVIIGWRELSKGEVSNLTSPISRARH